MSAVEPKSLGEFDLIRRYFTGRTPRHAQTIVGVGDDCAVLTVPDGAPLAITADSLVAGVHFFQDVDPSDLGHKSLAVNLSDLAAMGAIPVWITLCLTLPAADPDWLEGFASGLSDLAQLHGVELIGGDTTRGPLSVTVQAFGRLPSGEFLRRSGAQPGDLVFVTGALGDAGLGLKILQGTWACSDPEPLSRLLRPHPRVAAGQRLLGQASACIDVSDGLAADLGHILSSSAVGATLDWEQLPLSTAVLEYVAATDDWALPLVAGEDYELCFTAPARAQPAVQSALAAAGVAATVIGTIEREQGLRVVRQQRYEALPVCGYDHFAAAGCGNHGRI